MDYNGIADQINTAVAAGSTVTVDGHRAFGGFAGWSGPANVWGTGSLSVTVHAKKAGARRDLWYKGSATPTVVVTPAGA